jgi:phosphoribosylanthranilate isomerase
MRRGAVQVAGISDVEEALLLVGCGVEYLGFPLRLDHHAEDCSEAEAADIVAAVGGRAQSVLITYEIRPAEIAALARFLDVSWVQLHAPLSPDAVASLRERAPELRVMKSLVVRGADPGALERELEAHAPHVDAFLTDTFDPATGASGATGRTHDWAISRALAERSPRPLVLAGGLGPDNVRRAVLEVGPAAVDVHTGVEGPGGRKDEDLVRRFVAEARAAFAARHELARL